MTSLDILYYCLALGFLLLVGGVLFMMFHIMRTLRELTMIVKEAKHLTSNLTSGKWLGALTSLIPILLRKRR